MTEIVFRLFGADGFVNPVPNRFELSFYDSDTGKFLLKQSPAFDGGWRWFSVYDADAMCIYNTKLHKMAHTHLTTTQIEGTVIGPEFLLNCAKAEVMVEHACLTARDWLDDKIRADFRKLRREIFGERASVSSYR